MAQLSKQKTNKYLREEINKQLWKFLSNADNELEARDIYSDLLTETEKIILANRVATALLLLRNKGATQIRSQIHVSFSTINSVSAWLKNMNPKTYEILTKLSKSKDWEQVMDKIENSLDKLPPKPYTNWSEAGKRKLQNKKKRDAVANLR